mmetsp:Transcript_42577/g.104589  ORF Transcript_42577/g.104589 Transcript_42577/m.104589 type:complete len:161 (+) Transcript_42577:29-511(+)
MTSQRRCWRWPCARSRSKACREYSDGRTIGDTNDSVGGLLDDGENPELRVAFMERLYWLVRQSSNEASPQCSRSAPFVPPEKPSIVSSCSHETQEDKMCAICLESYYKGQQVCALACCHHFHESCALQWLHRSELCPICQTLAKPDARVVWPWTEICSSS